MSFLIHQLHQLFPSETFTASGPRISSSSGASYYGKVGSSNEVDQYRAETRSLELMSAAAPGLCPRIVLASQDQERPFMISNYLDLSSLSSSSGAPRTLARRLATELHGSKSQNGKFGFECPTFCGATRIDHGWYDTWADAYSAMVGGLLDKLESRATQKELCVRGREVQKLVIPHYLGSRLKDVQPVLCHGDLWSGNVGADSNGNPAIFDPASYYGHNESDLAIGRMFGGFSSTFYEEYHSHLPKSEPVEEYDERLKLYQLFHYLNHTVLFGSGYAGQSMSLANQLLKSLPK